ncbi:MAG: hypothetical protein PWQ88_695 [Candidatus Methanomethylophilaceae archaeon]|nr:MAG: Elongation factor Tu domain 2 protein [Methanomicrobiales archaeon 53_19]MDI3482824.1 hypothetical protein [Candidatus Methanomethylophilaceae archaeon]MDI3542214.1 hypothetical protein [Candidatus Methanomethylophilaceae archaeon]HIJ00704.1 elongation factor Tu [Candidatus Methanomethylophilaceae archaeon]
MPNLNVVVLGLPGYAGTIAKKSGSTDINFYDIKRAGAQVSLVEPLRYPERLAPLFYACSMADMAILVVEKIDHLFGEMLIMLDCLGIHKGWIVLHNYILEEQIRPLLNGTVGENYHFVPDDANKMREELLDLAEGIEQPESDGRSGTVPINQHFNVRGVGTVVLGKVVKGTVRRHDTLTVYPLGNDVIIRSIQKHDDDYESASVGDRVGLALRGIDTDRLDRGQVLSNDPLIIISKSIVAEVSFNPFWKSPLREGMVIHLGHWMQVVPCKVISVDSSQGHTIIALEAEEGLIHLPSDEAVIMHLEGGKLRVAGKLHLP